MTERPCAWPPVIREVANDPCTDLANAIRLARNFGEQLAYVPGLGWMVFDSVWRPNELGARRFAARIGKLVATETTEASKKMEKAKSDAEREKFKKQRDGLIKWAKCSENAGKMDATLRVAETLLKLEHRSLDADPHLLGCNNGVVDLRTGELRVLQQSDFITQSTGIDFNPGATAPTFNRFLSEVFQGDAELIQWWSVLCGYAATACVSEHILPVAFGNGSNGKSTLLGIMQRVLGSYAQSAAPGLLIASKGDRHPTELMDLRGARLVVASESGDGGRLNEEGVKLMTGGDKIKARGMRQDFVEFAPTFKLVLQTNHKPVISGSDNGIWRRMRLVPFLATFEGAGKDPTLPMKLQAEAPGILAWIVRGAREWFANGFPQCAAIDLASAEYKTESDTLGTFFDDECLLAPQHSVNSAELYARYKAWAIENGLGIMSKRTLAGRLQERSLLQSRGTGGVRRWTGVALQVRDDAETLQFSRSAWEARKSALR
jgi:putative DNA primase/helicase